MNHSPLPHPSLKAPIAAKVVGIYLIIGCLWIFFSDQLLKSLAGSSANVLTQLQTLKGWFYVLATATLLYWLINRETRATRIATKKLKHALEELQTTLRERQATEAKLQEREGLLRLFVQNAPAGIAMFDREMHLLIGSQRWVDDYYQGSLESMMGRSHYELFPDLPERWRQIHQRCLAGAIEKCDEDLFVRADGWQQWTRWETRPWYTATNEIGGIIIFAEDITERKQSEIALQELNAQLEQRVAERTLELKTLSDRLMEAQEVAHIGSWDYDITTGKVFWSDEIFRIFGLTPGQPEPDYESHLAQNFPPEDGHRLNECVRRALEQAEPYEVDVQIMRADGSTGWILAKGKPILNEHNQVVRLVGVALDITERKAIEAQQQQLSQMKDDFLNTVSHELRSPLATIKMAVEMVEVTLDRVLPPPEPQVDVQPQRIHRYLGILREQCDQELELVNNLLDLQRLEADRIQVSIAPIDVIEWAANIAAAFEGRMQERQQHLQVRLPDELPPFSSDVDILTSVLRELLTNACKYTPPGETITVNICPTQGHLQLKVSNSGVQIAQEDLERIFEKFYRIPKSDQWKQGGTGLGLALIQKQVDYLGGTMWAESDEWGVHFMVRLPLESAGDN